VADLVPGRVTDRPDHRRAPTGATRVAAVVGTPVRHSLSPALLNAAFAATHLDWTFVAFDVAEGGGRVACAYSSIFTNRPSTTYPSCWSPCVRMPRLLHGLISYSSMTLYNSFSATTTTGSSI
jgi:hypothetical protein